MSTCGCTWDVCDVAGLLIGSSDFLTQKKEVENTLGIIDTNVTTYTQVPAKQTKEEMLAEFKKRLNVL
jgi:hypothetical protein